MLIPILSSCRLAIKVNLSESSRLVSTEHGGALAEHEGFLFVETSALNATNVDKAFSTIFDTIHSSLPKKQNNAQEQLSRPSLGEKIQLRPSSVRGGHGGIHGQSSRTTAAAKEGGGCC
ncbi:uncharacterized protein ATC70_011838 [Mucor velutinosus]|uniref:Uncharacterized protein n=1 Tax=Mucor velutinosus TaxID=708070 RepID=A0AAN7DF00_9FUNG|nr:hypothetical protein ATC70_011838 [Mucor velutinosus]